MEFGPTGYAFEIDSATMRRTNTIGALTSLPRIVEFGGVNEEGIVTDLTAFVDAFMNEGFIGRSKFDRISPQVLRAAQRRRHHRRRVGERRHRSADAAQRLPAADVQGHAQDGHHAVHRGLRRSGQQADHVQHRRRHVRGDVGHRRPRGCRLRRGRLLG